MASSRGYRKHETVRLAHERPFHHRASGFAGIALAAMFREYRVAKFDGARSILSKILGAGGSVEIHIAHDLPD